MTILEKIKGLLGFKKQWQKLDQQTQDEHNNTKSPHIPCSRHPSIF